MKLHYLAIVNRIKSRVPEVKHIDLYNQQYLKQEEEHPFLTPAVFIEFSSMPWLNQGDGTQEAPEGQITLHLVDDDYSDSWQAGDDVANQTPAMAWIELIEKLHQAFNNFAPKGIYVAPNPAIVPVDAPEGTLPPQATDVHLSTDWQRSNQEPDTDADNMRVEKLTYDMCLFDYSATPYYKYISVMVEPNVVPVIGI